MRLSGLFLLVGLAASSHCLASEIEQRLAVRFLADRNVTHAPVGQRVVCKTIESTDGETLFDLAFVKSTGNAAADERNLPRLVRGPVSRYTATKGLDWEIEFVSTNPLNSPLLSFPTVPIRSRYMSDTGSTINEFTGTEIQVVREGDLYLARENLNQARGTVVAAALVRQSEKKREFLGPLNKYLIEFRTGQIEPFEEVLPEQVYLVFARTSDTRSTHREMPAPENTFWVSIGDGGALRMAKAYLDERNTGHFIQVPRPVLTGKIASANNGNNCPWWGWSVTDPSIAFVSVEAANVVRDLADLHRVANTSERYSFDAFHPLALVDSEGRVLSGQWRPAEFPKLASKTQGLRPANALQAHLMEARGEGVESSLIQMTETMRNLDHPVDQGNRVFSGRVRFYESPHTLELDFSEAVFSTMGMATGLNANPHFKFVFNLRTAQGIQFELVLQNDFPFKPGTPIALPPYRFGNAVSLRVGSDSLEPVRSGTLEVIELEIDPQNKMPTSLKARIAFETHGFFQTAVSNAPDFMHARGVLEIHLPRTCSALLVGEIASD